jgi:SPP1 family predicted phage head-tail adaptor
MGCKSIKIKSRKVCVGDLSSRIKLQLRSLTASNTGSIESIETFTDIIEVWAAVETTSGSKIWDGVEIANPFTHKFYIRYRNDIEFTEWIEYGNEKYKLIDVENLEQKNEFLILMCTRKGTSTKKANYA